MTEAIKLVNESTNKFVDISSELYRQYLYYEEGKLKGTVHIDEPQWLSVSAGGHRVLDAGGMCHYVPKGWLEIKWKPKGGQPHFVK